ncbi:hypothetical protein BACCIP111895_01454 [Neobacillus rhizosphaerae]|uniref:Uncharacterized protein n=1 Tax=Neobacillus rhizosphaerae TaxID=2880965 RepID=A0ABM9ENT8_9BACI|nr:hypothetical protein [Neobacillus rhizosphaerae]CAH2714293.1 hypothetical protein BACCIP111895_01454 [Neobacillus rhizosphaerae]
MAKKKDYLTTAPRKGQMTVNNGAIYPNQKYVAGNSVDEDKYLEEANTLLAADEIGQQNENL